MVHLESVVMLGHGTTNLAPDCLKSLAQALALNLGALNKGIKSLYPNLS